MTRSTPPHEETTDNTSSPVPIEEILTLATRAPSVQNSQPWAWRWNGEELVLRTDPSRRLWRADPSRPRHGHQLRCRTAPLVVAAAGLGWRAAVHRESVSLGGRPLAAVTFTPRRRRPWTNGPCSALSRNVRPTGAP